MNGKYGQIRKDIRDEVIRREHGDKFLLIKDVSAMEIEE